VALEAASNANSNGAKSENLQNAPGESRERFSLRAEPFLRNLTSSPMPNSSDRNSLCLSVRELAELVKTGIPTNGADTIITGFASLREAGSGDLSFLSNPRYRQQLADTRASVVLVPVGWTDTPAHVTGLAVQDPSAAFEKVVEKFGFQPSTIRFGIHPSAAVGVGVEANHARIAIGAHAVVEEGAHLGDDVEIGAGCFVGKGVHIGSGSRLYPNVTVLDGCILGKNVILHSGTVIGADGFGYEFVNGRHRKIRQAGIVQIDDDVEIGANTTVDRARFGRTWIGEGTKIDNQVQIAHNVVIGRHCIIVAGVGIAGSAQIGDGVVIAAQAGVAGHVTIGSRCTVAARSGVTKDLPPGPAMYMGFPAGPAAQERRRIAAGRQVPELLARVKKLEQSQLEQSPNE
jgi:UDP-3-O-[3-hydroxymyristoyl] glucosamine N-acyltransferase